MIPYDRIKWRKHYEGVEARVPHFYLDGVDVLTIGIGCVARDPFSLPLLNRATNQPATRIEIQNDVDAIRALPKGYVMNYYKNVAKLYLKDDDIDALFFARLDDGIRLFEAEIISLDGYPDDACLAVMDMAFNVGTHGLMHGFPNFTTAFKKKDWHGCFMECERKPPVSRDRNAWTKEIFESLERTA